MHLRVVVMLLLALLTAADAKKGGGGKKRKLAQKKGGSSLGGWTEATEPMHKTICAGRTCRPGEGNLVGYEHWKQPYEPPPEDIVRSLSKRPVHEPTREYYAGLIDAATLVQEGGLVLLAAADFDYREMALNWQRAARRTGIDNALVHCLDDEAYGWLKARDVPVSNGTATMLAWARTKFGRHIQRSLAERHMAAAALVGAGMDVLLCDTTAVVVRDVRPFFKAQPTGLDLLVHRGGCGPKNPAGCSLQWNFMLMRGSAGGERRGRIVAWVQAALARGLIDFYLRVRASRVELASVRSREVSTPHSPHHWAKDPSPLAVVDGPPLHAGGLPEAVSRREARARRRPHARADYRAPQRHGGRHAARAPLVLGGRLPAAGHAARRPLPARRQVPRLPRHRARRPVGAAGRRAPPAAPRPLRFAGLRRAARGDDGRWADRPVTATAALFGLAVSAKVWDCAFMLIRIREKQKLVYKYVVDLT